MASTHARRGYDDEAARLARMRRSARGGSRSALRRPQPSFPLAPACAGARLSFRTSLPPRPHPGSRRDGACGECFRSFLACRGDAVQAVVAWLAAPAIAVPAQERTRCPRPHAWLLVPRLRRTRAIAAADGPRSMRSLAPRFTPAPDASSPGTAQGRQVPLPLRRRSVHGSQGRSEPGTR
jgi:hypothetical protein